MAPRNPGPTLVRAWRYENKRSQAWLGRRIGYKDGSYIYLYESEERPLPIDRLPALSEETGIPLDRLAWPEQLPALRAIASGMQPPQAGEGAV